MHRPTPPRLAAALSVGLLALSGCGTSSGSEEESDTLRIAGPFEVHSLDPAADGEVFTRLQVVETLVTSDIQGELAPGLATTWSSSSDYKEWEFELVEDVTFHDGTALTPEVVVAALEKAAAATASPLAEVPIEHLTAEDSSVVVELDKPYLTLPAVLTHYSTVILAPGAYEGDRVTSVIGTGPYQVDRIELPASIETVRFDDWRGEAPAIERVTFQAVGRAESRALMAVSDQADIVFGLEPAGRQRVDSSDGVAMESGLQPRTILLKVNAGHPTLKDLRVRRALSLALDREAMAEAVLREKELAATQLLPPSLETWAADVEPLTQDVEAARALLAEAGWEPGADGTLHKDGRPLELKLLTYPDRPELPALATAIQAAMGEIGMKVDVEVSNSSEIPAGQADGSLELALIAKHFALVSDPLVDVAAVFAPEGSDWGVMNWSSPAVQEAIDSLEAGASGADAEQHRATVVRTVQEELPLIPVAWYRMNAAVNDRVEGFVMDPLEANWRLTDLTWAS
ncbi:MULTISPECIES: ABC transporter substrate-binding protein [Nocardioides]|uniref:ABC transporter substrate-binding protein n=1 Tax=Nocardioides vastitatis TaxID=2568655 RepID=A0ABW0ZKD0_9ACTN|nr:ABC transporter substrate-binding protein [Nocardioides sp.]THI97815.1 ABC transporter substrate-binding protein [Nocardioides sp.]